MKKLGFGPSNNFVNLAKSELRGALVQRGTHHTPIDRIGISGGKTHIHDEEYDSNHRTDCTDDGQAQAAIQLKKTQRVRVGEGNYCG